MWPHAGYLASLNFDLFTYCTLVFQGAMRTKVRVSTVSGIQQAIRNIIMIMNIITIASWQQPQFMVVTAKEEIMSGDVCELTKTSENKFEDSL